MNASVKADMKCPIQKNNIYLLKGTEIILFRFYLSGPHCTGIESKNTLDIEIRDL